MSPIQTLKLGKECKKHEFPCPSSENNKAYFQCCYGAKTEDLKNI